MSVSQMESQGRKEKPAWTIGEDLETEILVRLPPKSLMRFKCVKKSWNALFRTPTFVAKHRHAHTHARLMILHYYEGRPCITILSHHNPSQNPQRFRYPDPHNSHSVTRITSYGHCNGVFCLLGSSDDCSRQLILWNPTTKESKLVPPPPHSETLDRYHRYASPNAAIALRGFGANPNTNDLKLVLFIRYIKNGVRCGSWQVYNLSTDSWTRVRDQTLPPGIVIKDTCRSNYNTLLNGVYHWLTARGQILCFDFRNDKFHKLEAPAWCGSSNGDVDIAVVNDSIACVVYVNDVDFLSSRLEFWVMDQQNWAWAKKYSIGPLNNFPQIYGIGLGQEGAQVLGGHYGEPLTSYDSDGHPVQQFLIHVLDYFVIHEYMESIVPLGR